VKADDRTNTSPEQNLSLTEDGCWKRVSDT
jgi:hypothetical protein